MTIGLTQAGVLNTHALTMLKPGCAPADRQAQYTLSPRHSAGVSEGEPMRLPLAFLLAGWLVCHAAPAAAGDSQDDRVTLTGLTPISVVVEELSPVAQKNGLTTPAVQAEVERRLRQAGISLTPDADAYLYVHITVADPGGTLPLPYVVDVSLMQVVALPRGVHTRTPLQCPTWGVNSLGMVSGAGLKVAIGDRVAQFADQFIRAYQSVNPKR
jgi:hypothetical protein